VDDHCPSAVFVVCTGGPFEPRARARLAGAAFGDAILLALIDPGGSDEDAVLAVAAVIPRGTHDELVAIAADDACRARVYDELALRAAREGRPLVGGALGVAFGAPCETPRA